MAISILGPKQHSGGKINCHPLSDTTGCTVWLVLLTLWFEPLGLNFVWLLKGYCPRSSRSLVRMWLPRIGLGRTYINFTSMLKANFTIGSGGAKCNTFLVDLIPWSHASIQRPKIIPIYAIEMWSFEIYHESCDILLKTTIITLFIKVPHVAFRPIPVGRIAT